MEDEHLTISEKLLIMYIAYRAIKQYKEDNEKPGTGEGKVPGRYV